MRITRIELKDFRNYHQQVFDLSQPRTLFLGENGAGKSTVIDAISWALTGRCRGVDGKGAGQKELIRSGASGAEVLLDVDGIGTIHRVVTPAGANSNLPTGTILQHLGVTADMLLAVLHGATFFRMHHADAKALLMGLLDVRVPLSDLPEVTVKPIDPAGGFTLAELESLYEAAYADRASLKKAAAAVRVPDAVQRVDLEKLDTVQLQADLAHAATDRDHAAEAVGRLQAELRRLRADLADAEGKLGDPVALAAKKQAHQDMLAEHRARLADGRAALAAAEDLPAEPVDDLKARARDLGVVSERIAAAADNLKGDTRPCVLGANITCQTPAKEFTGAVAQIRKELKQLDKRIAAGTERAAKMAAAQAAIRETERNVTYHEGVVADVDRILADLDTWTAKAADLRAAVTETSVALDDAQTTHGAARLKVEGLQAKANELAAYQAAQRGRKDALAKKADLDDQLKRAEVLVDQLGPKGLRARALQAALDDFQQTVNYALAGFHFQFRITVDPWRIEIDRNGWGWVSYDMLSAGEQLWTGLGFQLALAATSGLDFTALDAAEVVVGRARPLLTGLVLHAPVGQVLVAMARADSDPDPEIDGLQVVRLIAADAVPA